MTKLRSMDLSSNFFTKIPKNHIPSSVQVLDLSCLQMEKLPAVFGNLQKLTTLTITGCSAQTVRCLEQNVTIIYFIYMTFGVREKPYNEKNNFGQSQASSPEHNLNMNFLCFQVDILVKST